MRADILVFDHSKFAFAALKAFLIQYGYTVLLASNLDEARRKLTQRQFDLIITQENIRISELQTLCEFVSKSNFHSFILSLSPNITVTSRITLLETGADDCLSVPYHPKELLLRLEKLLQHAHFTRTQFISTDHYQLDIKSGDLTCPWGKIELRKKEFMIMSLLLKQKNRVVSKQTIIEQVWGLEETPLTSTVDVHIRRIRNKIKDVEKNVIKTAYGIGYMFCE